MNKILTNFLLIIVSIFAALFIAEGAARLYYDSIDFLRPVILRDDLLRYRIEPGSGAHDEWGFRNKRVPESAEIVALGDSHTYGISAQARTSWPSQLQSLNGNSVYNLSLPGYGPAEYFLLIRDKALSLKPETIVVGFYLGNDMKDSFTAVYRVPVWEELRDSGIKSVLPDDSPVFKEFNAPNLSDWLSANSVLYRLVSSSVIGDNLRQRRKIARGEEVVMLNNDEHGITTGFTPDRRLKGLDLEIPEVENGVMLALEFFNRMNILASQNETGFLVVIIPTKESVFSNLIEANETLPAKEKIKRLIDNERLVNRAVKQYFTEHGIEYIDVLSALQEAALKEQIYPSNFSGHTNKNGYRIIAETVNEKLKDLSRDQ